ncbi:MAG: 16S rRNA (uracil(1498)-N(3))-methyltransferase [Thermoanaerobaculaceae bacterium]|jgi:16S rRNA (uracil1498-N3)-methyltransferase|nr:16S rRNA (uracil(1498)-N(3))-methyltransferase [Thermoanaerobaculaceae bacterium]
MSITRLVWKGHALQAGDLLLPPEVSHHARVTRVGAGDEVEVLDLTGTIGLGTFLGWDGKRALVRLTALSHQRGEPPGPLVVGLGVLHTQAFDWATEKLTELGATRVVPLLCERVQGRQHEPRVERWQRLAEAAVAQCGRSRAPLISQPTPLAEFLSTASGARVVADPSPAPPPNLADASSLTVLVGPEGGLTEGELRAALDAGFQPLGLGPRILRAETAALAATAVATAAAGW